MAASQRRRIGSSNSSRRENVGAAFKEEEDEGGFGGLADEVEDSMPPQPPPPPSTPAPRSSSSASPRPSIRFMNRNGGESPGRSQDDFPFRRNGSRANAQSRRNDPHAPINASSPTVRIRRTLNLKNAPTEPRVDAARAAKWSIGRRAQAQQQEAALASAPAQERPQRQAFEGVFRPPAERPLSSYGTGRSIPLDSNSDNSYIPFDSNYSAGYRHKYEFARVLPTRSRQPFADQKTSAKDQEPVGWQPAAASAVIGPPIREPQPNARPSHETKSIPQPEIRQERPQETQQQFDEYGFPIDNAHASLLPQNDARMSTTRSGARETRSQGDRKTGRYARGRDEDDEIDHKKGQGRGSRRSERSSRDEDDNFDLEDYHRRKRERQARKAIAKDSMKEKADRRTIRLPDFIRVGALATELQLRYGRFAEILEKYGFDDVNSDYVLSADNAALIVEEAGFTAITESQVSDEDLHAASLPEDMSIFPQRPPVVTIMGHVDHGKTTILDYMRKSSIVASEHGGITQHIGAFSVPMPSGKTITFLDTPGHAAFLSMRQRGANVTDIVILVVAADDSVMPQTLEAIKHAKAANVPIIVAMNKIDKPEAKPDQVKSDLARHGVEIEDYGGDVQVVPVSGKTGQGMPDLEEAIIALSEIQDQRAPADGNVEGWVLESSTKEVGKVATVLIRRGTLRPGDIVVAGTEYCRVRTMRDEFGNQISEVGPGMPAEIDGWRGQPNAGDEVLQAPNEQVAGKVTDLRDSRLKRVDLGKDVEAINEQRKVRQVEHEKELAIKRAKKAGLELPEEDAETTSEIGPKIKTIYFIVKGDVAGSVEAVVNSIAPLGNSEVRANILKASVGAVSESDLDHATAAGGQVISFNTAIAPSIRAMAERAGTKILDHKIIYRLVDDVKASLEDVLEPITKSRVLGEAEIAQIFEINQKRKKVMIAGCKVRNGTISRNAKVKVLRGADNEVVYTGKSWSMFVFVRPTC